MNEINQKLTSTQSSGVDLTDTEHNRFTNRITKLNAIAAHRLKKDDSNFDEIKQDCREGLNVLTTKEGLQEMLAAQLLSIHELQQISTAMANGLTHLEAKKYFTNISIKLANTFVQQANLMSKLQGNGGQKIIVEHVDIHQGGQAIVGNINGVTPNGVKK